jgi:hypothetical protein
MPLKEVYQMHDPTKPKSSTQLLNCFYVAMCPKSLEKVVVDICPLLSGGLTELLDLVRSFVLLFKG